jgi:acetyl esterase/lipase
MSIRAWLVRRAIKKVFLNSLSPDASDEDIADHFPKMLTAGESRMAKPPADTIIESVDEDDVKGEWVYAPGTPKGRVIFYCHGGGYVWGSPRQYREFAWRQSLVCKARVFLVDYTLVPDAVCPQQTEETVRAYDYVLNHDYYKGTLVIAGDSAGGHLALAAVHALRDSGRTLPDAIDLISPWLDLTHSGESLTANAARETMLHPRSAAVGADKFRGDLSLDDPKVSPLMDAQNDLPPTLVQVGSDEILLSDSVRFTEKAKAAGVDVDLRIWKKMHHVWHMSASMVPEARAAIAEMATFFNKHWKE